MYSDPISDYLTRLRNAIKANHRIVEIPASNMKKAMTEVLYDQSYILKYKFEDTANNQGVIKIALKYNPVSKIPAIREIKRYSKPGLRKYSSADKLPRVLNGLGVAIVSTSHGVITDKKARELNVGGEVLCFVS